MTSTEQRLVRIRNELRAQKVASERSYSSILFPENAPTISYSGSFSRDSGITSGLYASIRVTFTRTDNQSFPPLVSLAVDSELYTFEKWILAQGGTVTGRDYKFGDNGAINVYTAETSDTAIVFNIDILASASVANQDNIPFSLNIAAVSPVAGKLSLERVI